MRRLWIGAAVAAVFAITAEGTALAQQTPTQPSIADPDQADQTTTAPAKPPRHTRKATASPAVQPDPDLDANDQLAPSQMKQPMPAAVAQPSGAVHPMKRAATDALPAAAPAPVSAAPKPMAPRAPRPSAADARTVACVGAFSKDSSHLRLAMTYESKNVTIADIQADGGTKVQASVLFPNDPKHRLEVWWANQAARSQTYLIVINGQSTWSAPGGMKLGLTLAQLEKLNHKPFKVKGFNKDGVASVSDWDGGVLSNLAGGCKSGLSLRADPKVSADVIGALGDDKEFSSSDAAIRAAKPVVSEILIGY